MTNVASVSLERQGNLTIAVVQVAELSSDITEALVTQVAEVPQARLILDVSKVKFLNSVTLGGLVVLLRRIKQNKGYLALVGLSGHSLNIIQVTGLQKVFELYDSVEAAKEAFQGRQ